MANLKDTYLHKGLRKKLVGLLEDKGIESAKVLHAINTVPRHFFLDEAFLNFAYSDKAFPIGAGQTISHPYTVAFQTQLLQTSPGQKILEIGTGCGYQTCVLMELGLKVFSIERQKELFDKTKVLLSKLSYAPKLFYGDGYKGNTVYAPFDGILVTCGAPFIPQELFKQLKIGGRLVIPVGNEDAQTMTLIVRTGENDFQKQTFGDFNFVPMLEKKAR